MESEDQGSIVVAGCGRMGRGMARALIAAGFDAWGFDVRPVEGLGDRLLRDPAEMRARAETLITVVRDAGETDALLFDAQRALTGAVRRLVICSTLSPRYLSTVAARAPEGLTLIDAPMSGAEVAAEERRLSFMLGGDAAALDAAQPLFDAMGARFHRMGGFGAGMAAKVLNNLVAASSVAATRRALDWAGELGLDRAALLALMHDSSGQTWFGSNFEAIEFARDGFSDDNTIGIIKKDVEAALDAVGRQDDDLGRALIDAMAAMKVL